MELIDLTLSILNGSIEKAWATKKTAAERMIIRDAMIIEPWKLGLNCERTLWATKSYL